MKYYNTFNSNEAQDVSFEQVIDMICNDQELQKRTQMYRDLTAQGQEKAAKEVKESTPQVAVSITMEEYLKKNPNSILRTLKKHD